LCCVTTAITALFCSTIFQKSATSLISTYMIIIVLFLGPVAVRFFADTFFHGTHGAALAEKSGILSPFAATFALPLNIEQDGTNKVMSTPEVGVFFGYLGWSILYNGALLLAMMRMFEVRWRVAD
jgi:hypothetical protein